MFPQSALFPSTCFLSCFQPTPKNPFLLLLPSSKPTSQINNFTPIHCTQFCTQSIKTTNFPTIPLDYLTPIFDSWPYFLKISIDSNDLDLGRSVHGFLVKLRFQYEAAAGNYLIKMYSSFGEIDCAQQVFYEMRDRNVVTWTSLTSAYLCANDAETAFKIVCHMHSSGEELNEHTWSVSLRACESSDDKFRGEQIHGVIVKRGFCDDVVVCTSLISMYSRSGCVDDAEKLFLGMSYRDVRCLNLMIYEYGKARQREKAIRLFLYLLDCGLEPTDYTLTNVLCNCSEDRDVVVGRQLHGLAFKHGLAQKPSVASVIISMYGKCGLVEEAERTFNGLDERNMILWTSMFAVFVHNGIDKEALNAYVKMVKLGVQPDSGCLAAVLKGCSEGKNLALGLQLHGTVMKLGLFPDVNVGTALIDLYAKCGKLQSARSVLDNLESRSVASFNAILIGFAGKENEEYFMGLINEMRLDGLTPDTITLAGLLSLSADRADLVRGETLHAYIIKTGLVQDCTVANASITMYARCGSILNAQQVFDGMNGYDVISWNAMISAFSVHGQGKKAIRLFEDMIQKGYEPDEVTILGVLQACSYSGLIDYGYSLFNSMEMEYGIKPVIEHFACMVDLLGRAGLFSEAVDFIKKSGFSKSPLLWRTLVHVCKLSGDLSFGKMAATHLLDLVPKESGSYILASNMFSELGMASEASKARTMMHDLGVSKEVGRSWIEINSKSHQFLASDKHHPESREIYANLNLLDTQIQQFAS